MRTLLTTLKELEAKATKGDMPLFFEERYGEGRISAANLDDNLTGHDKALIEFTRNNLPQIIALLESGERMKEALEKIIPLLEAQPQPKPGQLHWPMLVNIAREALNPSPQ